jgi:site-specific DNA-methyltransferase (adenine-specific)
MAGHDEWQTPQPLFDLLDSEFHFVLDAAATEASTKCDAWLNDGLTSPWMGAAVWCNPPYSNLPTWVERAWQQCREQKNTIVLLIPAYTDPKYWWTTIIPHADEVRFLKGRVSFLENGHKKMSARFPSVIVVFRYRPGIQKKQAHCWWWDWKASIGGSVQLFTEEQSV